MITETRTGKADAAQPQPVTTNGQHIEWLTATEAAHYLKVEPRTLLMWARQGKVKGYVLSGTLRQTWRFRYCDLDTALTANDVLVSDSPSVAPTNRRIQ